MKETGEANYLRTMSELQLLAQRAPHVTQEFLLQVASMEPDEMRRRIVTQADWIGHYSHALDGIEQIRGMQGSGIDGCRMPKELKAVVVGLLKKIEERPNTRVDPKSGV